MFAVLQQIGMQASDHSQICEAAGRRASRNKAQAQDWTEAWISARLPSPNPDARHGIKER